MQPLFIYRDKYCEMINNVNEGSSTLLHPTQTPPTPNPLSLCQPHLLSSTQRINYAKMNLTHKFLR